MTTNVLHKPTLCVHVGYGKTGSTAIQAWLASQQHVLKAAGIDYPIPDCGLGDSGNGSLLLQALAQPDELPWWLNSLQNQTRCVLFSREQLARELSEPGRCQQLAAWAQRWGFGSVQMLLFVRDPREHCYSLWAQKVKRAGERRSLATFAEAYDGITMATSFVQHASEAQCNIHILDFGKHRNGLFLSIINWLKQTAFENPVAAGVCSNVNLPGPNQGIANETPSHSQLRLQRYLHYIWPGGKAPLPSKTSGWIFHKLSKNKIQFSASLLKRWKVHAEMFNNQSGECVKFIDQMPAPAKCL